MSQFCLLNVSFGKQVVFKFGNFTPNLKNSICSKGFSKFLSFVSHPWLPKLKNLSKSLGFSGFPERVKFCTPPLSLRERKYIPPRGLLSSLVEGVFCVLIFFIFCCHLI